MEQDDDDDDEDEDEEGGGKMWSVNNSFWLVRSQQKSKNQESSFVANI